jgi:hypothetical protein
MQAAGLSVGGVYIKFEMANVTLFWIWPFQLSHGKRETSESTDRSYRSVGGP